MKYEYTKNWYWWMFLNFFLFLKSLIQGWGDMPSKDDMSRTRGCKAYYSHVSKRGMIQAIDYLWSAFYWTWAWCHHWVMADWVLGQPGNLYCMNISGWVNYVNILKQAWDWKLIDFFCGARWSKIANWDILEFFWLWNSYWHLFEHVFFGHNSTIF